ncbi:hypothetical protein [Phaeacidiphilus oryzae]|uniref:hypothetical protein n=1 Tax=Phaeacidiphilus oryzae TaxID=348818 RepID=UPI0005621AEB|nr:hypothetical protein [Phaeacidiphilus oryzae]
MTAEGAASAHAELAQLRAARARQRAARAAAAAERQERQAERTGQAIFARSAELLRSTARVQATSAELQEAYARRLLEDARRGGAESNFMTGVAEACGAPRAALTLVGGDGTQVAVAASDVPGRRAQELEFVLGEGPVTEAVAGRSVITAAERELVERWPAAGPELLRLGIGVVQAVPLAGSTAGSCLGVLAVFGAGPGLPAPPDRVRDCAEGLLREVLLGTDADPELYGGIDHRDVVHQAAGMLSARLGRPTLDVLAMIKARAWTESSTTSAIARQIVDGQLDLSGEQQ